MKEGKGTNLKGETNLIFHLLFLNDRLILYDHQITVPLSILLSQEIRLFLLK